MEKIEEINHQPSYIETKEELERVMVALEVEAEILLRNNG